MAIDARGPAASRQDARSGADHRQEGGHRSAALAWPESPTRPARVAAWRWPGGDHGPWLYRPGGEEACHEES